MSNEITASMNLGLANGTYKPSPQSESASFNQSVQTDSRGVLTCSTSVVDIPLGNIATNGWAFFKNLDANINIDIGNDESGTLHPMCTLKPGEFAMWRWKSGKVPATTAASGTPRLAYWIMND